MAGCTREKPAVMMHKDIMKGRPLTAVRSPSGDAEDGGGAVEKSAVTKQPWVTPEGEGGGTAVVSVQPEKGGTVM